MSVVKVRTATRRIFVGLWVLSMIAWASLAGCSSGGPPQALAGHSAGAPVPNVSPLPVDRSKRKIIKNARITLRVAQVGPVSEQVRRLAGELDGFVFSSDFSVGSDGEAWATIEVKIPADKLDTFLDKIGPLGRVVSKSETGEDVTDQFVDMEARLSNLRRAEERLLEILKKAGQLKDLLEVEREITRVRGDIEQTEGHLKHMSDQVAFSTVAVRLDSSSLTEAKDYWDLGPTVMTAWELLRMTVRLLLRTSIYLIFSLPITLPAWWLLRRRKRRPPVAPHSSE